MTQESTSTAVVVGVDGSEPSRRALVWAAGEAVQRGVALRVVHSFPFDMMVAPERDPQVRLASQHMLDVADHARHLVDDAVEVTSALLDGVPSKALVDESRRCALLVLGSRGHGGFANLLLGSTSVDVTARAECPVVVVPDREGSDPGSLQPVIVGVDASEGSLRALEFGFARAEAREARLVAVHVWRPPTAYGSYAGASVLHAESDRLEEEARAVLAGALARWRERCPAVVVDERVVRGQTVAELAGMSAQNADVVVVGSRGRTALAGMMMGSVSQGLLRHAGAPVVVVR